MASTQSQLSSTLVSQFPDAAPGNARSFSLRLDDVLEIKNAVTDALIVSNEKITAALKNDQPHRRRLGYLIVGGTLLLGAISAPVTGVFLVVKAAMVVGSLLATAHGIDAKNMVPSSVKSELYAQQKILRADAEVERLISSLKTELTSQPPTMREKFLAEFAKASRRRASVMDPLGMADSELNHPPCAKPGVAGF